MISLTHDGAIGDPRLAIDLWYQKAIPDDLTDCLHIRPAPRSPSYPHSHPSLIMEIELRPAASLFSPVEILAGAINSHRSLQRYKILFICGNYSRILSRLDRNFT
ncbi:MAG: hypothetical protein ACYDHX_02125 [Methanothrix sp.]